MNSVGFWMFVVLGTLGRLLASRGGFWMFAINSWRIVDVCPGKKTIGMMGKCCHCTLHPAPVPHHTLDVALGLAHGLQFGRGLDCWHKLESMSRTVG